MENNATILEELHDNEFKLFRDVIYRESGINLSVMKKALMQARLMKRMRELHLHDYRKYYVYLNDHYEDEVIHLINCITTNKTDFFREPKHFEYLKGVILPEYKDQKKKTIRIWSAGCSTGEEPYSIAITIHEYYENSGLPDFKILATDIDTKVLEDAKSGIYKSDILGVFDMPAARKYFLKGKDENDGLFRIKDFLKKNISFRRMNLFDSELPVKCRFDIIFCRNVIIYFDKESQKRVISLLHNYLKDDGYLFIGHSETLAGIADKFHFVKNTIYKKTAG